MEAMMRAWVAVCFLVATAAAASHDWVNGTASFFGGPQEGEDTAYNMTIPDGACGFGPMDGQLFPFYNVAGVSPNSTTFSKLAMQGCGACIEVECMDERRGACRPQLMPEPTVFMVVDQCTSEDCPVTNLNIHVFAFEKIAPQKFGRVDVRYRVVDCHPADNIVIHVSQFRATEGGWIRLSLKDIAGDSNIVSVEVSKSGAAPEFAFGGQLYWRPMENSFGANWEYSGLPQLPLDMRVTNSKNQQVIIRKAITSSKLGDIPTTSQFPSEAPGAPGTPDGTPQDPMSSQPGGVLMQQTDSSEGKMPVTLATATPAVTLNDFGHPQPIQVFQPLPTASDPSVGAPSSRQGSTPSAASNSTQPGLNAADDTASADEPGPVEPATQLLSSSQPSGTEAAPNKDDKSGTGSTGSTRPQQKQSATTATKSQGGRRFLSSN